MIDGLVMGMMGWHKSFLQHALLLALRDTRGFSQRSPSSPFVVRMLVISGRWLSVRFDGLDDG